MLRLNEEHWRSLITSTLTLIHCTTPNAQVTSKSTFLSDPTVKDFLSCPTPSTFVVAKRVRRNEQYSATADDLLVGNSPLGYPMVARMTSSAPEYYVFREFRYLQSRILLHLQDELRALETQLLRLDERDRTNDPDLLRSREQDDEGSGVRKILIDRIHGKLTRYGES